MTETRSGWDRAIGFADQVIGRLLSLGHPISDSSVSFLSRRAVFTEPFSRRQVSMGGRCHLLPTDDGWCAVHLPREDDLELLPAWLGITPSDAELPWEAIAERLRSESSEDIVHRAQELGLAVSRLPLDIDEQLVERGMETTARPWLQRRVGDRASSLRLEGATVVDLSSLWAGPLCARLLSDAGARVIKVESPDRPDASRTGDPTFFEWLHRDHESRLIDLGDRSGVDELVALLSEADVVIEASRPRAFDRLGIVPTEFVANRTGLVWLSITGYGRCGPWRNRVGFGDDTAVAGGLVDLDGDGVPSFVGDAIADPLTGLTAAALVTDAVARGGGVTLDIALREVARSAANASRVVW